MNTKAKASKNKRPENFEERLKFLTEEKINEFIDSKVNLSKIAPYKWIIFSVFSSIFFGLSSYPSKMSAVNSYQILFSKGVIGFFITLLHMRLNFVKLRIRYFKIRILFLFGLCMFLSSIGFIFSISFMDYSLALLIFYTSSFLSVILARIWIKEPIMAFDLLYLLGTLLISALFCLNKNVLLPVDFSESLFQNNLSTDNLQDDSVSYFIISVIVSVISSMMLAFCQVAGKKLTATKAHPTVFLIMIYFCTIAFGWIFVMTNGGFRSFTLGDGIYFLVEGFLEFLGYLAFVNCFYFVSVSKFVSASLLQLGLKLMFTQILFANYETDFGFFVCLILLVSFPLFYLIREAFLSSTN